MNLDRFLEAQEEDYEYVVQELRDGRKRTHWIWYIFPQIDGLGYSSMARRYAIASLDEARAYAAHPVLGGRLRECTSLVNSHAGTPIESILGYPDDLKFRSSMTLFASATEDNAVFLQALDLFYGGEPDPETLKRIA